MKQFQTESDECYIVFLYKTNRYKESLASSDEGEVKKIPLNQLEKADTVEDFDQLPEVVQKHSVSELYYEQNQVNVL